MLIGMLAIATLLLVPVFAAGPNWIPDVTFKATSLAGWHVLGQADWRVENGEVVGTVKPGGYGGWLVLDRSYQDVAFYANFRCNGGCRTGILLRAEKTAEGMKGIYVSLAEGDVASYRVTLDADGKELRTREIAARAHESADCSRRRIRLRRVAAAVAVVALLVAAVAHEAAALSCRCRCRLALYAAQARSTPGRVELGGDHDRGRTSSGPG